SLGNGLAGSGGGGGGDELGPARSSGSSVNGWLWALSKRAQPDTASNTAQDNATTPRNGPRTLMPARLRIVARCAPRRCSHAPAPHPRIRGQKRRANPRFTDSEHLPWAGEQ